MKLIRQICISLFFLVSSFQVFADNLTDTNKLFSWAEQNFPQYFSPPSDETWRFSGYLIRYYEVKNIYIGTRAGEVYVHGEEFGGLLTVGKISDFVQLSDDTNPTTDLVESEEPIHNEELTENEILIESEEQLAQAFENRQSDLQIASQGIVSRILSDDTEGSQHQRFIVQLSTGQTLLIAHNIDLAPRINSLFVGDVVEFYGEYEWNSSGGVIHWTHLDPQGNHEDGWLKHNNLIYQ